MLYAPAANVVDITLMPPIDGPCLLRSCSLPLRITPPAARNSSGSTKLKNAALGLRQNILRSSRYWRQLSTSASGTAGLPARAAPAGSVVRRGVRVRVGVGCQFQVHVLERRAANRQLLQAFPARKRRVGELMQQTRRVVGLPLDQRPRGVAVGDAIARPT